MNLQHTENRLPVNNDFLRKGDGIDKKKQEVEHA